jgi:hypothetical protein
VGGFWSTLGGALIIWVVNMALRPWVYDRGDRRGGKGKSSQPHNNDARNVPWP